MPFEDHPSFPELPPNNRIWRYMDLAKFLSLMTSGQLWFANGEVLARDDPQESLLPKSAYIHRSWSKLSDMPENTQKWLEGQDFFGCTTMEEKFERNKLYREFAIIKSIEHRGEMYINSWHIGESESAAMWKIYGASDFGIAITSTPSRVFDAFLENPTRLFAGRVTYVDHERDRVNSTNGFNAVMVKRNSFAYENEYRMVYWDTKATYPRSLKNLLEKSQPNFWNLTESSRLKLIQQLRSFPREPGIGMSFDLKSLIEGIWISPAAPAWFVDTVSHLCELVGFSAEIRHSTLLGAPTF